MASNLTAERTSFLGRAGELTVLTALLEEAPLVTVIGPGGGGKTRLVRELGRRSVTRFEGGVWFCDLSEARTSEELMAAIARSVELPLDGPPREAVQAWLRAKGRVLVLLDNCEQLDAAARAQIAALSGCEEPAHSALRDREAIPSGEHKLSPERSRRAASHSGPFDSAQGRGGRGCISSHSLRDEDVSRGRAHFVATSREPLGVAGEHPFELPPMSATDAAALFVDRGLAWDRRLEHHPRVVEAVVAQLEGLPLAIELVAARLDVLGAEELLVRLKKHLGVAGPALPGSPARHATLGSTLAWSWALLSSAERALLEELSVFRGGFSLAAVLLFRDVGQPAPRAGSGESEAETLSLLGSLRRRSLLQVGDGPLGESRYSLSESVRAFALQQLNARRVLAELRHAKAITALVRPWVEEIDGPHEQDALVRLDAERDNLLAVVERGEEPYDGEAVLALRPLLVMRGPSSLLPGDWEPATPRLRLARGEVRRLRGQLDEARADFEQALADSANDTRLTVEALLQWALLEHARGKPYEALSRIRRALKLSRTLGAALRAARADARNPGTSSLSAAREFPTSALSSSGVSVARCLGALGAAHQSLGRLRRAISAHARSLELLRAAGSPRLVGIELSYLAVATHRLGHVGDAEGLHLEALALHRKLGHRRYEAVELTHLGYVNHELGAIMKGRESYEAALKIFREVGDLALEGVALTFLGRLEADDNGVNARELLERALVIHRGANHARLEATTLALIGHLCRDKGDLAGARDHYAKALSRSDAVEVGFESLLEAWLGEVERSLGAGEPARRFEKARARAAKHENPVYALAVDVLAGVESSSSRLRALSATSSDLRRAIRVARLELPRSSAALTVARDGTWFAREDGKKIELARRRAVRLVLLALTGARVDRPGDALTWESLLAAGWPGERPVTDSGLKRVYTAIWTLRTLGLEELLLTRGDGYLLDPKTAVAWAQ